jgi:uncharacterized membrane protein YfcA
VAGLLSHLGQVGIGGGLILSTLLLPGLTPHQALATSTLAIVPTTRSGRRALGPWVEAQGMTLQKPGSSS